MSGNAGAYSPIPSQGYNPPQGPVSGGYNQPASQQAGGFVQAGQPAYPPGRYVQVESSSVNIAGQGFEPPPNKSFAVAYLITALIIAVLCLVDLLLNEWVEYCFLEIGLNEYSFDGDARSLSSAVNELCPSASSSFFCGDPCENMTKLRNAGAVMDGMGYAALASIVLLMLRMILLILKPNRTCGGIVMRIVLIGSTVVWIVGTIVYIALYSSVSSNTSNTQVHGGLVLAVIVSVMLIGNCVLGNVAVTKLR